MNAYSIISKVYTLINESSTSTFLDESTTYELLNTALREFARRTQLYVKSSSISIVSGTSSYTLPDDFLKFFVKSQDDYVQPSIYYNNNKITYIDYSTYISYDTTETADIPANYTLNFTYPDNLISGTATSSSTLSNGEVNLVDTSKSFTKSLVGATVHVTHSSVTCNGYVIAYNSSTSLTIATIPSTSISSGDSYLISPPPTNTITFYPTPSSSFTLPIYYTPSFPPIYSPYRPIPLPNDMLIPIACFICWLYKYKDREPAYGDKYFAIYETAVRRYSPVRHEEYRPVIKWQWKNR